MSDCEWFAQMTQDKWANVSESLRWLRGNERPWAIRSGRSKEISDVSESLISLTKNEQMSESLIFLSKLLIRSFFDKKRAILSEIKWANSQPWVLYPEESVFKIWINQQIPN